MPIEEIEQLEDGKKTLCLMWWIILSGKQKDLMLLRFNFKRL